MSDQAVTIEMEMKQALKAVHGMYVKQQISLLNALKAKYGPGVVNVVQDTNTREVCQVYRAMAEQSGRNSIDDLVAVLWEPLRSKGYVFTAEKTEDGVQICCTACPFASLYRAMGGEEWGYALFCAADEELTRAFNEKIGFKRSKTLMQGDDCCDHQYSLRER